jgi:hypothetical protein
MSSTHSLLVGSSPTPSARTQHSSTFVHAPAPESALPDRSCNRLNIEPVSETTFHTSVVECIPRYPNQSMR